MDYLLYVTGSLMLALNTLSGDFSFKEDDATITIMELLDAGSYILVLQEEGR
jgi:hypothetical protein